MGCKRTEAERKKCNGHCIQMQILEGKEWVGTCPSWVNEEAEVLKELEEWFNQDISKVPFNGEFFHDPRGKIKELKAKHGITDDITIIPRQTEPGRCPNCSRPLTEKDGGSTCTFCEGEMRIAPERSQRVRSSE